jgi:sugar phosphate isomerase/epimerase
MLSLEAMLDRVKMMGIDYVEMTTGGWSSAPHINLDKLLSSNSAIKHLKDALSSRGMKIAALNCSGNPLDPGSLGEQHRSVTIKTFELAQKLGVEKIVMMSGLPPAAPGDRIPNWISYTVSWPETLKEALRYQWEDVAIPYWKEVVAQAHVYQVKKIALENFSAQLVYNPETLCKLREAVGPVVGLNLDPSHLIWMGADPIASARALGPAIHHVHAKDVRLERTIAEVNGMVETKEVTDTVHRAWNYVAVGCGRDMQWWREFFSVLHMLGYDGCVSLEMEDLTMSVDSGLEISVDLLKQSISR